MTIAIFTYLYPNGFGTFLRNQQGWVYVSQYSPLQEASARGVGDGLHWRAWHLLPGSWGPYLHFHHVDGVPAAFDLL